MLWYLAGPITGLPFPVAKAWRIKVSDALLTVLDPLRFDLGTNGPIEHKLPAFNGMKSIVNRNYQDVFRSDGVIVNFDVSTNKNMSVGSIVEVAWAWSLRKPVIAILPGATQEMSFEEVRQSAQQPSTTYDHPYLKELFTYCCDTIQEAIEIAEIIGSTQS